jgi:hypothetical protein
MKTKHGLINALLRPVDLLVRHLVVGEERVPDVARRVQDGRAGKELGDQPHQLKVVRELRDDVTQRCRVAAGGAMLGAAVAGADPRRVLKRTHAVRERERGRERAMLGVFCWSQDSRW